MSIQSVSGVAGGAFPLQLRKPTLHSNEPIATKPGVLARPERLDRPERAERLSRAELVRADRPERREHSERPATAGLSRGNVVDLTA